LNFCFNVVVCFLLFCFSCFFCTSVTINLSFANIVWQVYVEPSVSWTPLEIVIYFHTTVDFFDCIITPTTFWITYARLIK
jgi:hypothetical protein